MDVYIYIRSKMDKNQKWTRIKNRQVSTNIGQEKFVYYQF